MASVLLGESNESTISCHRTSMIFRCKDSVRVSPSEGALLRQRVTRGTPLV